MEIVENALSSTADANAKLEAELAADTDAVTSAVPWEQRKIGALLSNAEGGPSPLFRVLQLVAAPVPFLIPTIRVHGYVMQANMEGPNELLWLSMTAFPCGFALLLLTLGSARVALQPDGPLDQLGAGEQQIAASGPRCPQSLLPGFHGRVEERSPERASLWARLRASVSGFPGP